MKDEKIKLLRYIDHLNGILHKQILPPIMADIDVVSGICNLDCEWCAQRSSRESKKPIYMNVETMIRLGNFCRNWGIKSWRIGGDSEPTLNPNIHYLFHSGNDNGIDIGLITNGILLDQVKDLNLLKWVGISLDAVSDITWSKLKNSNKKNFSKIIQNIKIVKEKYPSLNITLKCIKWSNVVHLSRNDLTRYEHKNNDEIEINNYVDAEHFSEFAKSLDCNYILRDALPKEGYLKYRFKKCRGTPLYATFGADHKFYLCCDQRNNYMLTDDYTRNNWNELLEIWGSRNHIEMIESIDASNCIFCSKEWLNTIIENIILDGDFTETLDINFI